MTVTVSTHSKQKNTMNILELSKILIEFYEKMSAFEDQAVKGSGLTTAQNHTIEIVGHEGSIKMKELAEKVGVTTGTLTSGIDRLEEKQLLVRVPHEKDRRSYLIELTEDGKKVFAEHHSHHLEFTRKLIADFTEEELADFSESMKRMLNRM